MTPPQQLPNPIFLNLFEIENWELELDPPPPLNFMSKLQKKFNNGFRRTPLPPNWDNVLKSARFFFDFIPYHEIIFTQNFVYQNPNMVQNGLKRISKHTQLYEM